MGGDVGASVVIPGAAISLKRHPDSEFLLYGDSKLIDDQLAKYPALKKASRVVHTDVTISMHDKPSQALRRGRKNSSMWLAIDAVKKGEADVVVSAGNDASVEISQQIPAGYPEVVAVASTTAQAGSNQCRFLASPIAADTASYFTTDGVGVIVSAPGAPLC